MDRFVDWRVRFGAYITSVKNQPFEWGKLDCALFAAGAVKAQTGLDLAVDFRGYRTELGGLRKARKLGFADHVDVFARALPSADRLRVGDIAIIQEDGRRALGVVQGRGVYAMQIDGLAFLDHSAVVGGFRV